MRTAGKHRPLTQYYPDGTEITQGELARRAIRDALFTAHTHQIADLHSKVASSWRYYFSCVAEGLRDE
ncbi:hypothetical protein WME99_40075 [Sorangium sp. So ce136]|uniref:hypothetical protein n=1 Tax=Sorangium sp. So ce136 TaxID=3133284 RepID=UPI003EFCFF05